MGRKENPKAAQVIALYQSGATYSEIKKALDISSEGTIGGILKRHGLYGRKIPASEMAAKYQESLPILKDDSLTVAQKAVQLNVSLTTIYDWMKKAGLKIRREYPRVKNNSRVSLLERLTDIYSLDEAAEWASYHKEELGLSRGPDADTIRRAAQDGRLAAVKKGSVWLTSESELRIYLAGFQPGQGGYRRVKL